MKKSEESLNDMEYHQALWKSERMRERETRWLFEEIMAKNFQI